MDAILIILSSTWKFAATFPIAIYLFKMTFTETILYTNIGGFIGIIVSLFFSKGLLLLWNKIFPGKAGSKKKQKKKFTKSNRRLVRIKTKYGMPGIAILTPVLLSIPIGTFLTTKYYGKKRTNFLFLALIQVIWSFIYTIVLTQIKLDI
ncbi:hypothetical protein [Marinilabilia salmonicolor]|jgi:hypothetical protein|uniref:Small multi-drug export protein n=1 Tax=Marinilabilia salmonicolor TaxID=989 RepID=A0A2T0XGZ7_9BACT|nr:hypothetical protein [Marinilabilia salmonicolor]PRY98224.1 hypothetical protein BY457_11036 [Marinilabilia salmonicolor]RCW29188.1 hypothetical protein DFO77_1306 [Marinilabilia salmonicolor]